MSKLHSQEKLSSETVSLSCSRWYSWKATRQILL